MASSVIRRKPEPVTTPWLLAGFVSIPFLSVTAAARLSEAASQAGPANAAVAGLGLLGGLITGLLVYRMLVGVDAQVRGVFLAMVAAVATHDEPLLSPPSVNRSAVGFAGVASLVFVPSGTGRRGPPHRVC